MVKKYLYHRLDPTRNSGLLGIYEDDTLIATCNTILDAQRICRGLYLVQAAEIQEDNRVVVTKADKVLCKLCGEVLSNQINDLVLHSREKHHTIFGSYLPLAPENTTTGDKENG